MRSEGAVKLGEVVTSLRNVRKVVFERSFCKALYSVRSERMLMEQLDYNLLFRWFVGLNMDDPIWDEAMPVSSRFFRSLLENRLLRLRLTLRLSKRVGFEPCSLGCQEVLISKLVLIFQ